MRRYIASAIAVLMTACGPLPQQPPKEKPNYGHEWSTSMLTPTQSVEGDLNGDGRPDRITYWFDRSLGLKGHGIYRELSQPDGSYRRERILEIPNIPGNLTLHDLTPSDGRLDLTFNIATLGNVSNYRLLGNGDGSFLDPIPIGIAIGVATLLGAGKLQEKDKPKRRELTYEEADRLINETGNPSIKLPPKPKQ